MPAISAHYSKKTKTFNLPAVHDFVPYSLGYAHSEIPFQRKKTEHHKREKKHADHIEVQ